MKRTHLAERPDTVSDDMLPEYNLDYRKARPNRFAERIYKNRRIVILDPDVSEVFPTAKSVNVVLRALVTAMPKPRKAKATRGPSSR
jgi:hypothetical protein